jgi:hypothetical protein
MYSLRGVPSPLLLNMPDDREERKETGRERKGGRGHDMRQSEKGGLVYN